MRKFAALFVILALLGGDAHAQRGGRSSGSSGSRSSSSSRPSSSRPSTPSSRPSSPSRSSTPVVRPSPQSPTRSVKPSAPPSAKAEAQRRVQSQAEYKARQSTPLPAPKANPASPQPSNVQAKPATQARVETHVAHHHYQHPAVYYDRPVSYGIGGYSNAFWWMMSEWSAERRAMWLYNHQSQISREAYQDAVRDAEVQRRISALEASRVARDASYIDDEFKASPDVQYAPPVVVRRSPGWSGFFILMGVAVVVGVCALILFKRIAD